MTRSEIIQLFLQDMQQPAIQLASCTSFRKYAARRDELIRQYVEITKLPEDVFHSALADELAKELIG